MKYQYALRCVLVMLAIFIAGESGLKAKAEFSDNFNPVLEEAESQTVSDLRLEAGYRSAQSPSPNQSPEASSEKKPSPNPDSSDNSPNTQNQDNLPKKQEEQPQECFVGNLSAKKQTEIDFGEIKVVGSTLLDRDNLKPIFEEFQGQKLTPELLKKLPEAVDKITLLYLNKGYINSRATLPIEKDGKIEISVIEGSIGKIQVYGLRGLNASYVCSRVRLGAGVPLNSSALENQLRLLRADPLFENVEATLRAPDKTDSSENILRRVLNKPKWSENIVKPAPDKKDKQGASTLVVRVKEANPFTASVNVDNYFPPVVGSQRFGVEARYRNFTGIGDEIGGSYYRSFTGGAEVWDFIYRVPLNPMNGSLQLRAAPSRNYITEKPFNNFGVRGTQELYEVTYRQPVVRSYNEEFALSLIFSYQNGQTFILNDIPVPFQRGPNDEGITRTSVIKFIQEYTKRDTQGAWSLRSQFNLGTGLFDATVNESPTPDGRYFAWIAQLQRVQRLSDDHLLLLQADLQLTPDNLLTSQQFIIGGGQSLRGYRENLRTGDNGFRFSAEDRFTLLRDKSGYATLQLAPYLDLGAVWNNGDNPNRVANENFLINTGLGFLWNKPLGIDGLNLRFDYSIPVLATSDRGNDIQDTALYFSVRYQPW
jgi:hemolysin activation/secretion protein